MAFGLVPNPMTPSTVAEQGNIAIIFIIITWPFLFIRLYIRFWLIKCPGPDDWLMIITQGLFTGYCVCNYEFIRLALTGEPQTVVEADQRNNVRFLFIHEMHLTTIVVYVHEPSLLMRQYYSETVRRLLLSSAPYCAMAPTYRVLRRYVHYISEHIWALFRLIRVWKPEG
jgi:hypothetical protein